MKKKCFLQVTAICAMLLSLNVSADDTVVTESEAFTPEQIQQWENQFYISVEDSTATIDKGEVVSTEPQKSGETTEGIAGKKYGKWSKRAGVICITDSYASSFLFNNGHAGIYAVNERSTIESNMSNGVYRETRDWRSNYKGNTIIQVTVKGTSVAQDRAAARWAEKQIGKGYNKQFFNISRRDKFYCSQLVWAAFKDTCKVDIGTAAWGHAIHPFELYNAKTKLVYRDKIAK